MERENFAMSSEIEQSSLDVSDKVKELLNSGDIRKRLQLQRELLEEIRENKNVTVTIDYTTLDQAKWMKSFLGNQPVEGNWKFAIRATESQAKEAANVFASGIEWIQVGA